MHEKLRYKWEDELLIRRQPGCGPRKGTTKQEDKTSVQCIQDHPLDIETNISANTSITRRRLITTGTNSYTPVKKSLPSGTVTAN